MAGKRKGTEDSRHLWPEMLRAIRECQPTWIVGENVPGLINWSGGLVFEQVCLDLEGEGYEVQPIVLPASGVNAPHRRDRVWFVAHNSNAKQPRLERGIRTQESEGLKSRHSERSTQNPNENGRGGNERKEESSIGRFGDIGTGDNERVRADNKQVMEHAIMQRCEERNPATITITNGQAFSGRRHPTDWTDWPTVAPLCSRNDGLSERLDGITFPKWRNESIKAGGNAIVPQVAYQIFKVIAEMDKK